MVLRELTMVLLPLQTYSTLHLINRRYLNCIRLLFIVSLACYFVNFMKAAAKAEIQRLITIKFQGQVIWLLKEPLQASHRNPAIFLLALPVFDLSMLYFSLEYCLKSSSRQSQQPTMFNSTIQCFFVYFDFSSICLPYFFYRLN